MESEQTTEIQKPGRGGARAGAGRRRRGATQRSVHVTAEAERLWDEIGAALGLDRSGTFEIVIREAAAKRGIEVKGAAK